MAKRSPILGYNHNVRYRGLIFHVQTEDSGVLSPHLFTHLFHSGVIVSTRKLVYDAGSDEGAIKSLMQAQHKAVMKDLRRGVFDDKIDAYLGGTPGLLPRGATDESASLRDSQPVLEAPDQTVPSSPPLEMVDLAQAPESAPAVAPVPPPEPEPPPVARTITPQPAIARTVTPQPAVARTMTPSPAIARTATPQPPPRPPTAPPAQPGYQVADDEIGLGHFTAPTNRSAAPRPDTQPDPIRQIQPRTRTDKRGSAPSQIRTSLPDQPPGPPDISLADGLDGPTNVDARGAVAAAVNAQANATIRTPIPAGMERSPNLSDSMNDLLALDLEEPRSSRDTDVFAAVEDPSDGVPGARRAATESVQPLPPPPAASSPTSASRAAALPPSRPVTRPPARPAMTPPQVMSRPLSDAGARGDSDAVEVYAPAPPSADTPPGIPSERPGQYSQHKRVSQKMPALENPRERSGAVPIPAGLGRPASRPPQPPPARAATPPPIPQRGSSSSQQHSVPQPIRSEPSSGVPRPRTPTPSRASPQPRSGSSSSQPNSGVVMTRPAVIVGAPKTPAQSGRIRKAREDEGRGFGQGLISEKSLDEVILAYLSEDADDK